jgi:hypothetical protein
LRSGSGSHPRQEGLLLFFIPSQRSSFFPHEYNDSIKRTHCKDITVTLH